MEQVARQLLRALRGHRSQLQLARRLGYRGNPVPKWEGGHRQPTASEVFRLAEVVGVDVGAAVRRFHPVAAEVFDADTLGPWLTALKGDTSQAVLAERSGLSRQQVGRALRGHSQPRLPEFLALVDAATQRLPELLAQLVEIDAIPALRDRFERAAAVRALAFEQPWSPAALAVLETLAPGDSEVDALEAALPLSPEDVGRLLEAIETAGVRQAGAGLAVDVRPTQAQSQALRAHWAEVTADRMRSAVRGASSDDLLSFNVFAVSRADLQRIRQLQRAFYREVRTLVADSEPEVAAMLLVHSGAFEP